MAMNPRTPEEELLEEGEQKGDLLALLNHAKENPILYSVGIGFVAFCALFGTLFRMQSAEDERELTARYARALEPTDPAEMVTGLEVLANEDSSRTADALYMLGESAYAAGDLDKAGEAFARLRDEFSDFEYTPSAVEGLGFIAQENENYDEAVARFQEVQEKWPTDFAGRRQGYNLGRAQERGGNYEEAIAAYRNQLEIFPASNVARRAQNALDRLRTERPEFFEQEQVLTPVVDTSASDALEGLTIEVAPTVDADEGSNP